MACRIYLFKSNNDFYGHDKVIPNKNGEHFFSLYRKSYYIKYKHCHHMLVTSFGVRVFTVVTRRLRHGIE